MIRALAGLVLMVALCAGCGGDIYAGGFGHVEAEATSDGPAGSSQRSAAAPVHSPGRLMGVTPAALQGTVQLTASVALLDASGAELTVVTQASETVRLAGGDTVSLGGRDLPAATYPRARVRFTRVVANLESPLLPGGPVGEVRVQIAPGEGVIVEAPVELVVRPNGRHAVIVDLNAAVWIPRAVGGVVQAADLAAAVELRAR